MADLIQAIYNGQAVTVSNGSFKDQARAATWMIEGQMAEHQLLGTGLTPGHPEDQSAYWSELFGLWGILASLKQFADTHNIGHGQVTIACNSQSALKKAQQDYPTEPGKAHYDLISTIQNLQWVIPIKLRFEHIKGHQDQGMITALPWLAWMNIEMDLQAKHALLSAEPNDIQDKIPFEGWTCLIGGWHSIKHLTVALCRHLNGKILANQDMNLPASGTNYQLGIS